MKKKGRPRGRPRGFNLDKAIATALELFHRRGYDGVGVAELSKAIGITAPSLYSAFGNKRSLFEQVLKHYVQTEGRWLPATLASDSDLETTMAHFFLRAAEAYSENPERCGCLVMDATRNCADEGAKALTAEFQKVTREMICDRIAQGAPEISAAAANTLADYVTMILAGLSSRARDGVPADALRATAEIAAAGFDQKLQDYRE